MKIAVYRATPAGIEVTTTPGVTTLTAKGLQAGRVLNQRPGEARRRRMESTPEGQAMLEAGRLVVAEAMAPLLAAVAPLAQLRLTAGLSQADVFCRIGIQQPQLSRLENGRTPDPSMETLSALADLYGVTMDTVCAAIRKSCERATAP